MATSTYQIFRDVAGTGPDLVRVQQEISRALVELAEAIPTVPDVRTFVATAIDTTAAVGYVAVPPVKDAAGTVVARALVGARLLAAVDLSTLTDRQVSFETTLSKNDQIKQTVRANLSASKILFVVQS